VIALASFKVYDPSGSVEVSEDKVEINAGKHVTASRKSVTAVSQVQAQSLGKVLVEVTYYDMFGNAQRVQFSMHEHEFKALKKELGK
jgi:hypothetical protein